MCTHFELIPSGKEDMLRAAVIAAGFFETEGYDDYGNIFVHMDAEDAHETMESVILSFVKDHPSVSVRVEWQYSDVSWSVPVMFFVDNTGIQRFRTVIQYRREKE